MLLASFVSSVFYTTPVISAIAVIVYYISEPIVITETAVPFGAYTGWYAFAAISFLTLLNMQSWCDDYDAHIDAKRRRKEAAEAEARVEIQRKIQEAIERCNREIELREKTEADAREFERCRVLYMEMYGGRPISVVLHVPHFVSMSLIFTSSACTPITDSHLSKSGGNLLLSCFRYHSFNVAARCCVVESGRMVNIILLPWSSTLRHCLNSYSYVLPIQTFLACSLFCVVLCHRDIHHLQRNHLSVFFAQIIIVFQN